MSSNRWARSAAVTGFLGVALGAFGAHALKERVSSESLEWWQTGVLFHLLHVVPWLLVAVLFASSKVGRVASGAFAVGIVLFSGSLYAMALGAPRWLGAVTPLGGLAFLVGWAGLAVAVGRKPLSG